MDVKRRKAIEDWGFGMAAAEEGNRIEEEREKIITSKPDTVEVEDGDSTIVAVTGDKMLCLRNQWLQGDISNVKAGQNHLNLAKDESPAYKNGVKRQETFF